MAKSKEFDVTEAVKAAKRRLREKAEIDLQQLARKMAATGALTDADVVAIGAALESGVDGREFEQAVNALSRVESLTARVAAFDYEACARNIALLEGDLRRMVAEHRTEELASVSMITDARTRSMGAETSRSKLDAIRARYPHAFSESAR